MMVCVFPLPECPYAKKLQLPPCKTCGTAGATIELYTAALSSPGLKTALKAGGPVQDWHGPGLCWLMDTDSNEQASAETVLRAISRCVFSDWVSRRQRANTLMGFVWEAADVISKVFLDRPMKDDILSGFQGTGDKNNKRQVDAYRKCHCLEPAVLLLLSCVGGVCSNRIYSVS